jgi:hypothetical protein
MTADDVVVMLPSKVSLLVVAALQAVVGLDRGNAKHLDSIRSALNCEAQCPARCCTVMFHDVYFVKGAVPLA